MERSDDVPGYTDMNTTCPQCGKQMTVSTEELALRDGRVVCPQCLTAYQAVPAGDLPHSSVRTNVVPPAESADAKRFCPHCGRHIDRDINFCPYCGGNLRSASPTIPSQPSPPLVAPLATDATGAESGNPVDAFEWKPMLPTYRYAGRRNRQPASRRFQAVAIAVIIALLALLAFIIYQAMKL